MKSKTWESEFEEEDNLTWLGIWIATLGFQMLFASFEVHILVYVSYGVLYESG